MIPELKIGYFSFFHEEKILATVLNDTAMDLILYDLGKNLSRNIVTNAGRSIHKVPGINSMSYTVINEQKKPRMFGLNLIKANLQFLIKEGLGRSMKKT